MVSQNFELFSNIAKQKTASHAAWACAEKEKEPTFPFCATKETGA